jgi:serine/threonine-protein phosphatase 5
MSKSAVDLKNEGNKSFAAGDYISAVDLYSKAIELNDKEPTFFTNRAQVRRDLTICGESILVV